MRHTLCQHITSCTLPIRNASSSCSSLMIVIMIIVIV